MKTLSYPVLAAVLGKSLSQTHRIMDQLGLEPAVVLALRNGRPSHRASLEQAFAVMAVEELMTTHGLDRGLLVPFVRGIVEGVPLASGRR